MRKGFLGCALVSVAGASLALAQGPSPYYQSTARDGSALPADVAKQAAPVTTEATGKTGTVTAVPAGLLDGNCGANGCGGNGNGNGVGGREGQYWINFEYLGRWDKDGPAP